MKVTSDAPVDAYALYYVMCLMCKAAFGSGRKCRSCAFRRCQATAVVVGGVKLQFWTTYTKIFWT
eukprot:330723-Amphidinium_carterae.1